QSAQERRQRVVGAAQRILGFSQHGLQMLRDFPYLKSLTVGNHATGPVENPFEQRMNEAID
ncbi:MAG: hypothetical protein AAGK01_13285, partial [Pseudomonadota bacterium]